MMIGDLIDVMPHHESGKEWTIGKVGAVIGRAHEGIVAKEWGATSPVKKGWWILSVYHDVAKGGFAYVSLPEMYLGPHNCTEVCPTPHIL